MIIFGKLLISVMKGSSKKQNQNNKSPQMPSRCCDERGDPRDHVQASCGESPGLFWPNDS